MPYIKHFRGQGYFVVAIDRNPLAPGAAEADFLIPVSTFDYPGIRENISESGLERRIAALCCPATGQAYISAARSAAWLGVPYPTEEAVLGVLDKYRMWQALAELSLTRRKCMHVNPSFDFKAVRFMPAVVKPRSAGGASKGVAYCRSGNQLARAVSTAASLSPNGEAIIESFCPGEEVKIAGFLQHGRVKSSVIARRCFGPGDPGVPIGLAVGPSEGCQRNDTSPYLQAMIEQFCRHVGLTDTPFNIDIMLDPVQPELIDFDMALGSIRHLMAESCGIDVMGFFSQLCMGQPLAEKRRWWRGAAITYLWCRNLDTCGEELVKLCSGVAVNGTFSPDSGLSRGTVTSSAPLRVGSFFSKGETLEAAARAGQQWLHRIDTYFRNSAKWSAEVVFPIDSAWNDN
ncbi:MAG: hypothetical protein HYV06_02335 [Deltaproteobacteria bacterium]|nr:hypothetical protein [Deltaproteobacteria bacterium]